MKKNISINISGIIFHIEEDGYDNLRAYLDSINKYFSSYDDSSEIISDIESRIAEIFLSKLDDQKQVITIEDVNLLIETMGTIADFEAIEEEPAHHEEEEAKEPAKEEPKKEKKKSDEKADPGKSRLYRDEKRRVIGGVAAGIGYYFSIDPLWIRLIFVVLFLNLFVGVLSGSTFLLYVILWIVVPGSRTLGDDENVKKMFRDPESRVLGGVASGIAAYFGIDVTVVRLLFVLSIFLGGTGVILYIIFWIITPEAKTITQKMQMQGEPVTLSGIQDSIKKSLHNEEGEESAFAKILLFPFRALAAVFDALGNVIGPFSKVLVEVLRIFAGAIITLTGLMGMISLILLTGLMMGFFGGLNEFWFTADIPYQVIVDSFSPVLYIAALVVCLMPLLLLTLLGISVLAKKIVFNGAVGWPIFGIWLVGMISLAIFIPKTIASFSYEADHNETRKFEIDERPITMAVRYVESSFGDSEMLRIRGHEDSIFVLKMTYSAHGNSRKDAVENAKMITYRVVQEGDRLIFDSNFEFDQKAKFRNQELDMTLFVPLGHEFILEDDMECLVTNTFGRYGYRSWQINEDYTWAFSEDGLQCVNCPESDDKPRSNSGRLDYYDDDEEDDDKYKSNRHGKGFVSYDMTDFDQIDIYGVYDVELEQDNEYKIEIRGPERFMDDVFVNKIGKVLEVNFTKNKWKMIEGISSDDRLKLYISSPNLKRLKSSGFCTFDVDGWKVDDLRIELSGGSTGKMDIKGKEIEIDIDGGSSLDLEGKSDYLNAKISGASSLKSSDFKARFAEVRVTGVSTAKVYAREKLKAHADGVSTIRYYGDPDVDIDREGGMSTIKPAD